MSSMFTSLQVMDSTENCISKEDARPIMLSLLGLQRLPSPLTAFFPYALGFLLEPESWQEAYLPQRQQHQQHQHQH